jgi:coenzyme PQQ precursor peptide PqqA
MTASTLDSTAVPFLRTYHKEEIMAWTTPTLVEVCVGMEVTSYESAEI